MHTHIYIYEYKYSIAERREREIADKRMREREREKVTEDKLSDVTVSGEHSTCLEEVVLTNQKLTALQQRTGDRGK
jgi:hypothetical protein